MFKKIFVFLSLFLFLSADLFAETTSVRLWSYNQVYVTHGKKFGYRLLFSFMDEFAKSVNGSEMTPGGYSLTEFETGPEYHAKLGPFKLILPWWYHYLGFPNISKTGLYSYSHSIDMLPILVYKRGPWTFNNRFFLHNTFFSTLYEHIPGIGEAKWGYSLMMKYRLKINYGLFKTASLFVFDEPVIGLIQDPNVPANNGPGFLEKGLDSNKVSLGMDWTISKAWSVELAYRYFIAYAINKTSGEKEMVKRTHFIFTFITYHFNL